MLSLDQRLEAALSEDLGRGDITSQTTIPAEQRGKARFEQRQAGVLCGLSVAARVFSLVDPELTVHWHVREGQWYPAGVMGEIEGSLRSILIGERLALNLLQRLSGIATLTHHYKQALGNSPTRLLDTRKTTPLWRDLEKQAVRLGGGHNHRLGLDDGILIKDNHIAAAGGVRQAIERAQQGGYLLKVECEVTTLDELREALATGVDRVLLDNMNDGQLSQAHQVRQELAPHVTLEASGNMTLERLPQVGQTGVDFVSVGALTHSAPALDIALEVVI